MSLFMHLYSPCIRTRKGAKTSDILLQNVGRNLHAQQFFQLANQIADSTLMFLNNRVVNFLNKQSQLLLQNLQSLVITLNTIELLNKHSRSSLHSGQFFARDFRHEFNVLAGERFQIILANNITLSTRQVSNRFDSELLQVSFVLLLVVFQITINMLANLTNNYSSNLIFDQRNNFLIVALQSFDNTSSSRNKHRQSYAGTLNASFFVHAERASIFDFLQSFSHLFSLE